MKKAELLDFLLAVAQRGKCLCIHFHHGDHHIIGESPMTPAQ